MKIDYRKFGRKKLASIWLTNEEQQKETARVKALTEKLSQEGYITVVYPHHTEHFHILTPRLLLIGDEVGHADLRLFVQAVKQSVHVCVQLSHFVLCQLYLAACLCLAMALHNRIIINHINTATSIMISSTTNKNI